MGQEGQDSQGGSEFSTPFTSRTEGSREGWGQPRGGPSPNLTITHTPGSWVLGQGESKCVAVELFPLFLCCTVMLSSILHIKKRQSPRDSYEFGLKSLSLYLL